MTEEIFDVDHRNIFHSDGNRVRAEYVRYEQSKLDEKMTRTVERKVWINPFKD